MSIMGEETLQVHSMHVMKDTYCLLENIKEFFCKMTIFFQLSLTTHLVWNANLVFKFKITI